MSYRIRRHTSTERILYGLTVGVSARKFLSGQLRFLADRGWDVHLTCAPDAEIEAFARVEGATYHGIPIEREPSITADLASLGKLISLAWRLRPSTAVMGTPKMSLLGLLACWFVRVPRRIYIVHGLKLEGSRGPKRLLLRLFEMLSCGAATDVVAVSPSLRERVLQLRLASPSKVRVLRHGSANGFLERDFPVTHADARLKARASLCLKKGERTALFIGRLTRDKGLHDLQEIWPIVSEAFSCRLIIVGELEPSDDLDRRAIANLLEAENVTYIPFTDDVRPLYASSDVMLMPTRREGLGNVAIEAALCGIPTLAYATTGTVDAVVPGVSGELIAAGDRAALLQALMTIFNAPIAPYNSQHMHDVMMDKFDSHRLWEEWALYLSLGPQEATSSPSAQQSE